MGLSSHTRRAVSRATGQPSCGLWAVAAGGKECAHSDMQPGSEPAIVAAPPCGLLFSTAARQMSVYSVKGKGGQIEGSTVQEGVGKSQGESGAGVNGAPGQVVAPWASARMHAAVGAPPPLDELSGL